LRSDQNSKLLIKKIVYKKSQNKFNLRLFHHLKVFLAFVCLGWILSASLRNKMNKCESFLLL